MVARPHWTNWFTSSLTCMCAKPMTPTRYGLTCDLFMSCPRHRHSRLFARLGRLHAQNDRVAPISQEPRELSGQLFKGWFEGATSNCLSLWSKLVDATTTNGSFGRIADLPWRPFVGSLSDLSRRWHSRSPRPQLVRRTCSPTDVGSAGLGGAGNSLSQSAPTKESSGVSECSAQSFRSSMTWSP